MGRRWHAAIRRLRALHPAPLAHRRDVLRHGCGPPHCLPDSPRELSGGCSPATAPPRRAFGSGRGGIEGIELHDPFGLPLLEQLLVDPEYHEAVRRRLWAEDPALADAWHPQSLELAPLEGTGNEFLQLTYRDSDTERPALILSHAAEALEEVAQNCYEEDLERARGRLGDQVDTTATELRRLEAGLKELRLRAQLPPEAEGVRTHREAILVSLDAIAMRLVEVEGESTELRTRLELLAEAAGDTTLEPDRLLSRLAGTPAAQVVERVATRLVEAELEIARLRGIFADEHPELRRALRRLEAENEIFQALFDQSTPLGRHLHAALGKVADRWHEERLTASARLASLEQRRGALVALDESKRERLAHLRAYEGDLIEREGERRSIAAVYEQLDQSLRDLELLSHLAPEVLQLFRAPAGSSREGVDPVTFAPLALLLAAMVAVGVAYSVDYLDSRVHDGVTLRRRSGVPCLAVLPHLDSMDRTRLASGLPGGVREPFHALASQVVARMKGGRVLLLTGAEGGAGRSLVAEQLGRATARLGLRTLLIDADLRRPVLHLRLGASRSPGLVDWLERATSEHTEELQGALQNARDPQGEPVLRLRPEEVPGPGRGALRRIGPMGTLGAVVRPTRFERLSLLAAGDAHGDPAALLGSARMGQLLAEARKHFPLIVIDAPPLARAADAQLMARGVDGIVFIARAGRTCGSALAGDVAGLLELGAPVIGTVLNGCSERGGAAAPAGERAHRAIA